MADSIWEIFTIIAWFTVFSLVKTPLPQEASFLANEDVNLKLHRPNLITIKLYVENVLLSEVQLFSGR
jgi:hypothetical protein